MRRWSLLSILLVTAAACGDGEEAEPAGTAEDTAAAETAQMPSAEPAPSVPATRPPAAGSSQPARMPTVGLPAVDEPWTPTYTGTVNPGMTREQVIETWGPPVTERALGAWTYLYFRNGCEASCGTFDVVFLENGQVVNAIVRGPGHTYGGASTSPSGSAARATPPDGTEE
jgi:hypothetical protein